MQKGMNFFTKQKLQAGEPMSVKKDRERFSIKFNENDPSHDAVIRLLEQQGPHRKAQFIVNAVLHYINCEKTPDILSPQAIDRESIEEIVMEILKRNKDKYGERGRTESVKAEIKEDQIISEPKKEENGERMEKEVDAATLALIADTMSAFRSN